mmetsp:Transcript_7497/g.18604  ORF Transcript_7497/g.18604 Transcript_7497/m.18604 type:complete len:120 (+) Transcript_7497:466-825(+)
MQTLHAICSLYDSCCRVGYSIAVSHHSTSLMNLRQENMVPRSPTIPPTPNMAKERLLYPFNLNEKSAGKTNARTVPVKAPTRSKTSPSDGLLIADIVTINQSANVRAACHKYESCLPSP